MTDECNPDNGGHCLHDRTGEDDQICCHCGDLFLPRVTSSHGEFLPVLPRATHIQADLDAAVAAERANIVGLIMTWRDGPRPLDFATLLAAIRARGTTTPEKAEHARRPR